MNLRNYEMAKRAEIYIINIYIMNQNKGRLVN